MKGKEEGKVIANKNADFQRIASRNKKDFLSEQCREIEENNKMGKSRIIFKKIRDIKEHFMQGWA